MFGFLGDFSMVYAFHFDVMGSLQVPHEEQGTIALPEHLDFIQFYVIMSVFDICVFFNLSCLWKV